MDQAQERLERIKAQNRERAKRYYEANKEAISERRRERRQACRVAMNNQQPIVQVPVAPIVEPVAKPIAQVVAQPVTDVQPANPRTIKRVIKNAKASEANPVVQPVAPVNNGPLTMDNAIQIINEQVAQASSRKLYISQLRTIQSITGCDDFRECLRDHKKVIGLIEKAKTVRAPFVAYSINSKKTMFQTILKIKDLLGLNLSPQTVKAYLDTFELYNIKSHSQTKERIATEEVMDFDQYLSAVKKRYGEISKEFIVASLYSQDGFRDDLQLKIVKNMPPEDAKENFIIIPQNYTQPLTIVLNEYKTVNRYGRKVVQLDKALSDVIRKYVQKAKSVYGSYLLGKQPLSAFIKKFNEAMGLNITINKLRQMRVSNVLSRGDVTDEERLKLARSMNHSAVTSEKYKRQVKK